MKPVTKNGFTLIEMAVVLMIVGLLLGGMLVPLSAQMDQRNTTDTQKQLADIKEALIGYAIANGRLPCPASSTSNGAESFASGGSASNGNCSDFNDGYVPAATLGIVSGVDNQNIAGFAVDAWGNRIRYAVTSWSDSSPSVPHVFTSASGMSSAGISGLSPDLLVCNSASAAGFSSSSCGTNNALTASPGVPAVIFSTGSKGATAARGADETANLDGDDTFVSTSPTATFDDLVVWISPNILLNRMVAAGKLP